ncbi:uncharacterized protein OCT59_016121 [Rhizophagus irregularis]|uniref:uncharacterized protein n=1 Tax=Rhizophagus irregularis TaxID=588596 RepID=UPI00333318E2|nr:hypothetical protein OCT59_016121 [Rhizophagus irregularis]
MTVTPTIDEGYAFIFANCTSSTNPLDLFTSLGKSTAFSLDMENYLFENHLFFIIRSIYKENANSTIACNGTIIDTDNRFPWNLQKFRLQLQIFNNCAKNTKKTKKIKSSFFRWLNKRNNLYMNRIVGGSLGLSGHGIYSIATPWTDVNFGNNPFLFFRFW